MNAQVWAAVGMLLLALVLPVAALRHGRISAGKGLRLAVIWLAIFVVAALAFSSFRG